MRYRWGQTAAKKRNVATLNRAYQAHIKNSANVTVVGLNDNNRAVYIASSKFFERNRFVRRLNKVGGKYIQEQQAN